MWNMARIDGRWLYYDPTGDRGRADYGFLYCGVIPCITVSGKAGGENHMWNMARIDGRWLYYDPTGDRGRADYGFLYCGVEGEALDRHTWDADWFNRLSEALFSL